MRLPILSLLCSLVACQSDSALSGAALVEQAPPPLTPALDVQPAVLTPRAPFTATVTGVPPGARVRFFVSSDAVVPDAGTCVFGGECIDLQSDVSLGVAHADAAGTAAITPSLIPLSVNVTEVHVQAVADERATSSVGLTDVATRPVQHADLQPALVVSPLIAGTDVDLDVQNVPPGTRVTIYGSRAGVAADAGVCAPNGECVDLAPPIHTLGSGLADALGTFSLQLPVHALAPAAAEIHLQAAAYVPTDNAAMTDVVHRVVDDHDLDGWPRPADCDDTDPEVNPDNDCDGCSYTDNYLGLLVHDTVRADACLLDGWAGGAYDYPGHVYLNYTTGLATFASEGSSHLASTGAFGRRSAAERSAVPDEFGDSCGPPPCERHWQSVGENIWEATGLNALTDAQLIEQAALAWAAERANLARPPGQTCLSWCSNYIDMAWDHSTHVGCAVSRNLAADRAVVVCNYGREGSIYGYPIYNCFAGSNLDYPQTRNPDCPW